MSSNFSFANFAKELNQTAEEGIAFQDKQLKWDTAEDGKLGKLNLSYIF